LGGQDTQGEHGEAKKSNRLEKKKKKKPNHRGGVARGKSGNQVGGYKLGRTLTK